jgi:hypothetical protein
MAEELGAERTLSDVRERFLHHFADLFGYSDIREDAGLKIEDRHPPSSIFNPRSTVP